MKKQGEVNAQAGEIIAALKAGKRGVIEDIYDQHRPAFISWAGKRFFTNRADLEDAWQEAATVFYDQVITGRLTELNCQVKTFLFAIANNWLLKNERKMNVFGGRVKWRRI